MAYDDFDEFAAAAWRQLRHAAWLLTGHDQDAEDLASGALAKTYAVWPRVRSTDPYAYARRCVVNAQIDRVRRHRGREIVTEQVPDRSDQPTFDGVADREQLASLLARLSTKERRILVLRYYFDRSEQDVAAELGVSVGTVKSTASRALAKLRAPSVIEGALS